jgi:hypothetical protein
MHDSSILARSTRHTYEDSQVKHEQLVGVCQA